MNGIRFTWNRQNTRSFGKFLAKNPKIHHVTSFDVSSEIKSVWVRNEILRPGFLGTIAEFTHVTRDDEIEALTSIILPTG